MGGISPMGNMPGMNDGEGGAGEGAASAAPAAQAAAAAGFRSSSIRCPAKCWAPARRVLPPFLTFAHQLHGNFLMGRETGRPIVGWLGVAMCILGLTGLVLWWPKRGQWKYAFKVRRTATGLRFHRELHAATGIWIFLVFMAVSFSGVVIAWPQTIGHDRRLQSAQCADGRSAGRPSRWAPPKR